MDKYYLGGIVLDAFFSDLVKKVISNYPLEVKHKSLEYIDEKKAEWPIDTNIGEVLLKKVLIDERYIEFMIYAIDYLRDNGVFTPEVLTTKLGDGFVKMNDEKFMLFEAVNGRRLNFESEEDLIVIMSGIASFHKASIGIELTNEQFSSFQTKWKNDLQTKFIKLTKWKEERAKVKHQNEIDKLFLKNINTILIQCEKALAIIDKYSMTCEKGAINKTLCYQNFDVKNLTIGEDGNLYFLDMSSLKIELQIHDMRRILNKVMKKEKNWNPKLMKKMILAYQEINPLTCNHYQLLKADLIFPHLFYDVFSEQYENTELWVDAKLVSKMKKIITLELSKERIVSTFFLQTKETLNDQ